jgi:hypothetical protein
MSSPSCTSTTSNRWYAKFPLDAYALGPFEFEDPVEEDEVWARVSTWEGAPVEQLKDAGVAIWPGGATV